MTYKYEKSIINELEELEDEYKINYKNEIDEVRKVYQKAHAFDEIKKRFEKEYKAEILEESLYYPENFDNSEFLVDVEHILYFEDVRYVKIKGDI